VKELRFSFPTVNVTEGSVSVVVPKLEAFKRKPSDYAPAKSPVFFNPVMELNRDIAVLCLRVLQRILQRDLTVCEPLAGCGIRGIRFAREVDNITKVVINDISLEASKLAKWNVIKNCLDETITVENKDANDLLSDYAFPRHRFDYVDIDPFGSPMPFVEPALRSLRSKGLLALTATDLASLCGVYPRPCLRRYGGLPLRTEYCHELAIRLLTGAVAKSAAKLDLSVRIVFSYYVAHYVRVYLIVERGAKRADACLTQLGLIQHCFSCFHRETVDHPILLRSSICPECHKKLSVAGPLWIGSLLDEYFSTQILEEAWRKLPKIRGRRVVKLLTQLRQEVNSPRTFYVLDRICDSLNLPVPSVKRIITELQKKGYQANQTHFNPTAVKTDASARSFKELILAETSADTSEPNS
jgi:tRNA (guanine26-N2/guanine27-N2)-dimethyltransferase